MAWNHIAHCCLPQASWMKRRSRAPRWLAWGLSVWDHPRSPLFGGSLRSILSSPSPSGAHSHPTTVFVTGLFQVVSSGRSESALHPLLPHAGVLSRCWGAASSLGFSWALPFGLPWSCRSSIPRVGPQVPVVWPGLEPRADWSQDRPASALGMPWKNHQKRQCRIHTIPP